MNTPSGRRGSKRRASLRVFLGRDLGSAAGGHRGHEKQGKNGYSHRKLRVRMDYFSSCLAIVCNCMFEVPS